MVICHSNDIATPEGDAPKRPMGRKKTKQLLLKVEVIHALKHLIKCGKKEGDAEK
jgi:hypothetical protein